MSVGHVKESTYGYATPFNKFTWTIDKTTIVEPIDKVTPPENPLPPPTRLVLTPFDAFDQKIKDSKFGNYKIPTIYIWIYNAHLLIKISSCPNMSFHY